MQKDGVDTMNEKPSWEPQQADLPFPKVRKRNPDGSSDLIYLASPIAAPGQISDVLEREILNTYCRYADG